MSQTPQVTLTAKLQDVSGAAQLGKLIIHLCGFGIIPPTVQGTANIDNFDIEVDADAEGSISTPLYGNDQIKPQGTFYCVLLQNPNGTIYVVGNYRIIGGGVQDLSTLQIYDPNFAVVLPTFFLLRDIDNGELWKFSIVDKAFQIEDAGTEGNPIGNPVFTDTATGFKMMLSVASAAMQISQVSGTLPGILSFPLADSDTGLPETLVVSSTALQVAP